VGWLSDRTAAQVLSLLSEVLGLLFPPAPRHAMSYLSVLDSLRIAGPGSLSGV
jgi:hypothetical protein